MTEGLEQAAREGGVELVWDRDAPHLIEQVILVDPEVLYVHTGRPRPQEVLARGIAALDRLEPTTEPARGLLRDLADAWSRGATVVELGPGDIGEASTLIRAMDAAFAELTEDLPLRTRSARLLADSKALERALPSILAYLRQTGVIAADSSRDDALKQLGLVKYAQPVLVAGPLEFDGTDVSRWPYVGVPLELIPLVRTTMQVRSVLTIENLESFNRHVRICRLPEDVVVYTGGFPSGAVLSFLRALTEGVGGVVHHWGDVDPGGIRIGRHVERSLGVVVVPHLMQIHLVSSLGRPAEAGQFAPNIPAGSAFFELGEYLRRPDARWLEQEVVDPHPIASPPGAVEAAARLRPART